MRGLLGSGLWLALGLLATGAGAQEARWRPVTPSPADQPGGVSLRRPVPLDETGDVTTASFSSGPSRLVRAKPQEQPPLPMPVGQPVMTGGKNGAAETAPMPTPAPAPAPAPAPNPSAEVWGQAVSRWVDGGGLVGGAPVAVMPEGFSDGGPVSEGGPIAEGCCPIDGCCPPRCCPGVGGLRDRLACRWACNDGCCPGGCIWVSAEYLLWSIKDGSSPPLVTASPAGTPRASAGVLGPGTAVLFGGNDNLDYNQFSGGRFTLGFGLPGCRDLGFESTYFFLGRRNLGFFAVSAGAPILARPINNVNTGLEAAQLIAFPDVVAGSVSVQSSSKLWGVEGNLRKRLLCGCNGWVDGLLGFRYLQLDERLNITEDLTPLEPALFTRLLVLDSFSTRNQFYGGQLGVEGECRWNNFFLGGLFKLGLGVMHEVVDINGSSVFFQPGGLPPDVRQGGLLALRTNIGRDRSNVFAVVPEVGVKVGYQLTDHVRIFAGYSFLYVSDVVRPGDQIDRVINRTQQPDVGQDRALVGSARPMPLFRHTDFWAHGANFGLEIKY